MAVLKKTNSKTKQRLRTKKNHPVVIRKSAKTPEKNFVQLGHQVWPLEKDILFRPDRYKYVRKVIQTTGCVFCSAASEMEQFSTLCLFKTKYSMIVLNKFPYNSGHLLILPRRHCADLTDLSAEEFEDLHLVLKQAMAACQKIYEPQGINIGMNQGAVSGAGIPDHLHYHLIPRWAGDLNFFPLIAETKVVIESLEQSYTRYRTFFQSI